MGEAFDDSMLESPSLHLRLEPIYSPSGTTQDPYNPISIRVSMKIRTQPGRFTPTTPLLLLPLNRGPTVTNRYDGEAIAVSTSSGAALILRHEDEQDGADRIRKWYLNQTVLERDIVVDFLACPRKTDKTTKSGPRIDLRTDINGGLIGMGEGFIPTVPESSMNRSKTKSEEWDIVIEWDLQGAPSGTRCAWSFGDGAYNTHRGTLDSAITHAIFAVGQLRRYPDWDVRYVKRSGQRDFGMYWFGESFLDMTALSTSTERIFNAIASFFSSDKPFRVFIREVHTIWGGTGASDSYLLEYSRPAREEIDDGQMNWLLAHETIHEYAVLRSTRPRPDGQQEYEENWYNEGIADYYGAVAPFRGGALTRHQLIKTLNGCVQAYYTSPALHMDYHESLRRFWEGVHIIRVSYVRGFMYLVAEDARIQAATKGMKSIDDIVLELYQRRLAGQSHDISDYRAMISDLIGKEEEARNYDAMCRGDVIVPRPNCFSTLGLRLVRQDMERFELGFDSKAMSRDNVIRNLAKGSRAAQAGVREGDEVVGAWMVWGAADHIDAMMQIKVRRGDEVKKITWWPRSFEKVECYAVVEA